MRIVEGVAAASVVAAVLLPFGVPSALAGGCAELVYRRNSIYKDRGYCFRTPEAVAIFGNAGCRYHDPADVPLTRADRTVIDGVVDDERAIGCPTRPR